MADVLNSQDIFADVPKSTGISSEDLFEEEPSILKKALRVGDKVSRNLKETLHGVGEAVVDTAAGIVGTVGGGLTGLGTLALTGGDVEAAKAVQQGVTEQLTAPFQPTTEFGQHLMTPPEDPNDFSTREFAAKIDPRRLLAAPGEIGREIVQLPLESWNAPDVVRYPTELVSEFAAYPIAGKAGSFAKAVVRDALVKKGLIQVKSTPTNAKILRDRANLQARENVETSQAARQARVEAQEYNKAKTSAELENFADEKLAQIRETPAAEAPTVLTSSDLFEEFTPKTETNVKSQATDLIPQLQEKLPTWEVERLRSLSQTEPLDWTTEDRLFLKEKQKDIDALPKTDVEGKVGSTEEVNPLVVAEEKPQYMGTRVPETSIIDEVSGSKLSPEVGSKPPEKTSKTGRGDVISPGTAQTMPENVATQSESLVPALTPKQQHLRYRVLADVANINSTPVPAIEDAVKGKLLTREEGNRILAVLENTDLMGKGTTPEKLAQDAKISNLINYGKQNVGFIEQLLVPAIRTADGTVYAADINAPKVHASVIEKIPEELLDKPLESGWSNPDGSGWTLVPDRKTLGTEAEKRAQISLGSFARNVNEINQASGKTPQAYTLYSGLDPTQLPTALRNLTRTAKEGWEKLNEKSRSVKEFSTGMEKTGRGLKQGVLSPETIMEKDPNAKASFHELARAEEAGNIFIDQHIGDYQRATQGIKKGSAASDKVGKALEGLIKPDELTIQERKAYEFMKKDYEALIHTYARKVAGSDEAYQKVLKLVALTEPSKTKVMDLAPDFRAEYEKLQAEQKEIRNGRKVDELTGDDLAQYKDNKQRMRDLRSADFRNKLEEGERKAYDVLSRQIQDYLPHLFDKETLQTMFTEEIADLQGKIAKTSEKITLTKYKNRLAKTKEALNTINGGGLITFRQLPSNLMFRFFEPRVGKEGYSFDALRAYEMYLYGITRKMFDEPAVQKIKRDYFDNIDPSLKPYTQELIDHYLGKTKSDLDWLAGRITSFEWMRTLGLNPRSAIANLGQRLNTVAVAGEKWAAKAEKMLLFEREKANELFSKSGIAREVPQVMAEGVMPEGMERVRSVVGYLFNKVELGNRKHAYLSGYLKALDQGKKTGLTGEALEAKARQDGINMVHKTQYRYGKLGTSKWARHGVGRVAMQFTSYPIKTAEFIYKLAKEDPVALMKYIAYAEGINYTAQELLDTDLSNGLGFGITWGEVLKTVSSLVQGDTRGAFRHAKQSAAPGGGMLPTGFGPAVSSAYKVAKATAKGEGLEQTAKELTPVIVNRLKQAYDSYKNRRDGKYPVYDTKNHLVYRANARQVVQRTLGPKVYEESKNSKNQEKSINLELERTEVISDMVKAILDNDFQKAAKLGTKYGVNPSSKQVKNELVARLLTRAERTKPGKKEAYQIQREGQMFR